jgi:hypothetical protein
MNRYRIRRALSWQWEGFGTLLHHTDERMTRFLTRFPGNLAGFGSNRYSRGMEEIARTSGNETAAATILSGMMLMMMRLPVGRFTRAI